jgi:hypothetical protein
MNKNTLWPTRPTEVALFRNGFHLEHLWHLLCEAPGSISQLQTPCNAWFLGYHRGGLFNQATRTNVLRHDFNVILLMQSSTSSNTTPPPIIKGTLVRPTAASRSTIRPPAVPQDTPRTGHCMLAHCKVAPPRRMAPEQRETARSTGERRNVVTGSVTGRPRDVGNGPHCGWTQPKISVRLQQRRLNCSIKHGARRRQRMWAESGLVAIHFQPLCG